MYNCFIIDDELHAIDVLRDLIKDFPEFNLAGHDQDAIRGLETVNKMIPDILFLDIEMPKLSGTELKELLHPSVKVVYTTGNPGFAVKAFETSAFDYLMKPISYKRFRDFAAKLSLSKSLLPTTERIPDVTNFIFVKCDNKGKFVKIELEHINYVESDNNYSLIVCKNNTFKVYQTLKEMEKYLAKEKFIRVHKSFIVNYSKIDTIDGNRIFLQDKTVLQLGVTYRQSFFDSINKFLLDTVKPVNR